MKYNIYIIFLIIFLSTCSPDIHDVNFEKGEWVEIKNANNKNGYCIIEDQVYGAWIYLADTIDLEEYLLEIQSELKPLSYSDSKTFEVCINPDGEPYARDTNNVYYPSVENILFFDGDDIGGEIYDSNIRINGADPKSFKYIGKGYAVDKNNMYYKGEKIKWNNHIISALQQEDCPDYLPNDYGMTKNE